jgi:hypothetical protein
MSDFQTQTISEIDQNIDHRPINSPSESNSSGTVKSKKRRKKRRSCCFVFLIIIFAIIGSVLGSSNNSFLGGVKNSYLVRQITNIIYPSKQQLKGESNDRINSY